MIRLDDENQQPVDQAFFKKEDLMFYTSSNLLIQLQNSDGNLLEIIIVFLKEIQEL